jgi:hypothetical protein
MVYPDDDELVSSTVPPRQGVAVLEYKCTFDGVMSSVHGIDYGRDKQYKKGNCVHLHRMTSCAGCVWKHTVFWILPLIWIQNTCVAVHLAYWKKTISVFMPDRLVLWVSGREEGDPSRSTVVNNLIRLVKKKKVRTQSVSSKAKHPMAHAEFRRMQKYPTESQQKSFYLALWFVFTNKLTVSYDWSNWWYNTGTDWNIQIHDSIPNALKTHLSW